MDKKCNVFVFGVFVLILWLLFFGTIYFAMIKTQKDICVMYSKQGFETKMYKDFGRIICLVKVDEKYIPHDQIIGNIGEE